MHILRRSPLLCLALGALAAVSACRGPESSHGRLWPAEWTRHRSGDTWVSGIVLGGEREIVGRRGQHLRMVLLGTGEESARVSLDGGGLELRWTVAPGERLAVDEEFPLSGRLRLRGGEGVVACEPRLAELGKAPVTAVLVLVDTLRDDFVSPHHTPRILKALGEGRRFMDTTANAPWTIPSVASLMTSRPVLEISARDGALIGIPKGLPTVPLAFFDAGFSTAALVANPTVHEANGFGVGFSELAVPDPRAGGDPWDVRDLVARGRSWLQERTGEDRFLYLHLMEPHEPFRDHRGDRPEPPGMRVLAHRERAATPEEEALIRRLYRGEVRHLDRYLGPFLEDLPGNSTVVLVSDHGELLGEHESWGHGLTLFQEVLKVPAHPPEPRSRARSRGEAGTASGSGSHSAPVGGSSGAGRDEGKVAPPGRKCGTHHRRDLLRWSSALGVQARDEKGDTPNRPSAGVGSGGPDTDPGEPSSGSWSPPGRPRLRPS